MSGDKLKKGGVGRRTNSDRETDKGPGAVADQVKENGDRKEKDNVDLIRKAVSEVMLAGMATLQAELKKDLSDFRTGFLEDINKKLDGLAAEMNHKIHEASGRIEGAEERLEELEGHIADRERWDLGVKETLTQLLSSQRALQDKVTDMEGRARRNNIRIYGVPEGAEGTSAVVFIENFIKSEFGEEFGADVGIERAHRALAPKPPVEAPPRSMVVHFLRWSVKEKILHAAWKKELRIQNRQVNFDHDYATDVQHKRKEYVPFKKILKENGIRFQTPLTRMRVFFDSGTTTYNSAAQAAEDLRKRGFTVGVIPHGMRRETITEDKLKELLPWEIAGTQRQEGRHGFQEQIREKLKGYRRAGPGAAREDL